MSATAHASDASHRTPDGLFQNPWPDSEPRGFSSVLRWVLERRARPRAPTPKRDTFPVSAPHVALPRATAGEQFATWIGHSTVLLQCGVLNILTDPVWSERASPLQWIGPRRVMSPALPLPSLPPLDIVLISHSHYDHLDKATVKTIACEHPGVSWVVPLELGARLRAWGARDVVELDWWQQRVVKGVLVTATPARHFSARSLNDRNRTLWCGYALEMAGHRAYFAGDTAWHPEFGLIATRCGPFDLVMLPIGAYDPRWFMHVVHMDPEEAVRAYAALAPTDIPGASPLMLAIHWGTFRLTDEPMDEPPRRATALWRTQGRPADRLWIARFGETRAW